jgi:catechol 2,3-dioxygenase-like lactoylglutathione lyase family enzyme
MPVQDIERAKGFYGNTLGLEFTNEDGDWAEVDANGLTIGLNGREPEGPERAGSAVQALPIRIPAAKTRDPPRMTCSAEATSANTLAPALRELDRRPTNLRQNCSASTICP